jgi:hypothetical protein
MSKTIYSYYQFPNTVINCSIEPDLTVSYLNQPLGENVGAIKSWSSDYNLSSLCNQQEMCFGICSVPLTILKVGPCWHHETHPAPHCQGMGYSQHKSHQCWSGLAVCDCPYIPYYAFSQLWDLTWLFVQQHTLVFLADKRASNNCIHQTGTCTLAIERRLGPLENHQETIYKTPPYPREKCCSEDRPTSMLLDVFPIIAPLTRSKWQEIIHIKRKTKEEREPDLQPHWEENFSGELGMYRAQSQTTMTTQLHSSPIRTQQVSGASQKPHSSRVSQYSHHLFPNPKMTQVTFTFKDKSHWRDIQLWNSSWCLCLCQPDPCIYNLPKSIVVVFTKAFRVYRNWPSF